MRLSVFNSLWFSATTLPWVRGETFLDNATQPLSSFFTRPQSMAPAVSITTSLDGQSPGYIFMGPYGGNYVSSGPRIYDKSGNLIWDGYGVVPGIAHNVHVCRYYGIRHLCFTQCMDQVGYGVGLGVVLNQDYRIVQTVQTGQGAMPVDQHEFQLVGDGETALVSFYQTVPYDLSMAFDMPDGLGYVLQGGFQEIDVNSGDVLFEWYSLNHVDPSNTVIQPNTSDVSGTGTSGTSGFDYFHINSVDKSPSGNYLISARHTGTIYYINGTDRTTIWQLSFLGRSDFELTGFNFSFQHDARIVSEDDNTTVISFFDNAWNGYGDQATVGSASMSSGQVVSLDHLTMTASLLSITYPPNNTTSKSQGNTQLLENGNVFHGWGDVPEFSEHDSNGNVLLAGSFAGGPGTIMNYRAFSFDGWESTPANTVPSVYAYAQNGSAPTYIYASWNGATTVAVWRFYATQNIGDEFEIVGNTTKAGFETLWIAPSFYSWWRVEAVGSDGSSLRNSSFTPTFTPSESLAAACSESGCAPLPTAGYINVDISSYAGIS